MKKRAAVLLLTVLLIINSGTTVMAAEPPAFAALSESSIFTDLSEDHWSYQYVFDLVRQGVINGYPDGSFQPKNNVTYGETFKLILLAIGVPEPEAEPGRHWAWPYIQLALDNRLVYFFGEEDPDELPSQPDDEPEGTSSQPDGEPEDASSPPDEEPDSVPFQPDGAFSRLDDVPSRLDVARMAARALDLTDISGDSPYEDCDDGYVVELYEKGIMEGTVEEDGTRWFYPDQPISREEFSAVIWRLMNIDVTQGMFRYNNYWLDELEGVSLTSFSEDQFGKDDQDRITYSGGYFAHGIDVSGHKGDIDWEAVAGDGIDFAIIRAGNRFYGRNGSGAVASDSWFERNMEGAIDAGLDVGAYFFSNAITVEEAIEEADLLLSKLEPYREHITYPVVCDWEYLGGNNSRAYGVDAKVITQCIDAFCSRVEEAGYTPRIYFNEYCGLVKMDLSKLTRYLFWYAEYTNHPSCIYDFQFWQYSSEGKVAGINSRVDMDLCFIPFD